MQYLARSFLPLLAFCSPVLADSPSTPGALRVEVYSDTAAELFTILATVLATLN